MQIQSQVTSDKIVYYTDGQDPSEECIAWFEFKTRKLRNFWGTIVIDISPNTTNVLEVVKKLAVFEMSIIDSLA